jgi:hypothetical protein
VDSQFNSRIQKLQDCSPSTMCYTRAYRETFKNDKSRFRKQYVDQQCDQLIYLHKSVSVSFSSDKRTTTNSTLQIVRHRPSVSPFARKVIPRDKFLSDQNDVLYSVSLTVGFGTIWRRRTLQILPLFSLVFVIGVHWLYSPEALFERFDERGWMLLAVGVTIFYLIRPFVLWPLSLASVPRVSRRIIRL